MDKEKVIRYLVAVGYTNDQIKNILGQPALRSGIEKQIIELELKYYSSSGKHKIDDATRTIVEKMLELKEQPEEYRKRFH